MFGRQVVVIEEKNCWTSITRRAVLDRDMLKIQQTGCHSFSDGSIQGGEKTNDEDE